MQPAEQIIAMSDSSHLYTHECAIEMLREVLMLNAILTLSFPVTNVSLRLTQLLSYNCLIKGVQIVLY